jgi:hypothetical protein
MEQYGPDPCTRQQAADHEAGHCVLMIATGEGVRDTQIMKKRDGNRSVWLGLTHGANGRGDVVPAFAMADQQLMEIAVTSVGGIAGEQEGRTYHPASSINELAVGSSIVGTLARRWGVPTESLLKALMIVTRNTISFNRGAFDDIRRALVRSKKLTGQTVADLGAAIHPIDVLDQIKSLLGK